MTLPGIGRNQRVLTNRIDQPREAMRVQKHGRRGFRRKYWGALEVCPGNLQSLLDISTGFNAVQRSKLRTQSNSLFQLPQAERIEFIVQFRLPDQDDLQQLIV